MEAVVEAIRREPVRALYLAVLVLGAAARAMAGRRPDAADAVLAAALLAGGEAARGAVVPTRAPELVEELDEIDVGDAGLDVPEDLAEEPAPSG